MRRNSDSLPDEGASPVDVARESITDHGGHGEKRYSSRQCRSCHAESLQRSHTPWYLRPFRWVPGLRPRAYRCDQCKKRMIVWRREAD